MPFRGPALGLALALAIGSLASLSGCGGGASDARPNLVLIVVDTLRFDHVGCYGSARDTTPAMDAFAAQAVRFEHAYSTAPWTCPSVATILTGKFPSGHGLMMPLTGLADEVVTLAEMLRAEGYATAAVVSNSHLKKKNAFDQGFDTYLDSEARWHTHVSTPGVTKQAIDLVQGLAEEDRPFFLFVLYFDPHYEYKRHPEYGFAQHPGRLEGTESIYQLRKLGPRLTDGEIGFIRDVYDEEIRFTDAGIGRLLEALRGTGELERTAVAITADHGEEFFERGWLGHTRTLYEELIRVPLIVRGPGAQAPRTVATPVSLVSLAPTLLDIAGIDPRRHGITSPSLAPFLAGGTPAALAPIFAEVDYAALAESMKGEEAHKHALRHGDYKVIRDDTTGAVELYDLAADPLERRDLAAEQPDVARELLALLEQHAAAAKRDATAARQLDLNEEDLDVLRGLGYGW